MIEIDPKTLADLSGHDPGDPSRDPKEFQIDNILYYLERLEERRQKSYQSVLKPGGAIEAFENLHEMQYSLYEAKCHVLRLQQLLQEPKSADLGS